MRKIVLKIEPFPVEQIPNMLKEHGILINHYAEEFFAHPRFEPHQIVRTAQKGP